MIQVEESLLGRITELSRRVGELESRRAAVAAEYSATNRAVLLAGMRHSYRRLQQMVRRPAQSFVLWPLGLMLVGALVPGLLTFAMTVIATGSMVKAIGWLIVVSGIFAAGLACVLFVPDSATLETVVLSSAARLQSEQSHANELRIELGNVDATLHADQSELASITQSVQYQRELLLRQNWKAMRGDEWEAFLADVFRMLGASVQPTGKSGDQGVDLIVELGANRYALQAKGYVSSVGNAAVQEAVAGMRHYRCNCCAVVTNSRFTPGAVALAESNCCKLIGEDELPALILGKLDL